VQVFCGYQFQKFSTVDNALGEGAMNRNQKPFLNYK